MDRQCSSCGGFCKKSGCEREDVKSEPTDIAPPQREWQGLTDEEVRDAYRDSQTFFMFARAIEAALKAKNA